MKKLSLSGFLTLSLLAVALPNMASAQALTDSAKAADLQVSDAKIVYKKGNLDLFVSIKNDGKVDEKLGGADTPLNNSGVVEVTKEDGKEVEKAVDEGLPAGKTVEFSHDDKWLRIKDVAEPKETDVIPVALFFRRSPNAKLVLALNMGKAAKSPTHASNVASPAAPTPPSSPSAPTASAPASGNTAPAKSSSILDWFKK